MTFLIMLNNLRVLELHEVWILYEADDMLSVPKILQALMVLQKTKAEKFVEIRLDAKLFLFYTVT